MVVPALSEGSGSGLRLARSLELVRPAQVRHPRLADSKACMHHSFGSSGPTSTSDKTLPAAQRVCASPCPMEAAPVEALPM